MKKVCQTWKTFAKSDINTFAQGKSENYQVEELSFSLSPGEEKVFFETKIPGRILGFEINSNQPFQKDISLNAIWDKETIPAINIPLQEFFGYFCRKTFP